MIASNLLKYLGAAFLLGFAYQGASAQGFDGILPFESTCEDVKRILGGKGCGQSEEILTLPEEKIRIVYFTKKCQQFYGENWNMPAGMVVVIQRSFTKSPPLEKIGLEINENEFSSTTTDVFSEIIYRKNNNELELVANHGYVNEITYFPPEKHKSKICQPPKTNSVILKRKNRKAKKRYKQ